MRFFECLLYLYIFFLTFFQIFFVCFSEHISMFYSTFWTHLIDSSTKFRLVIRNFFPRTILSPISEIGRLTPWILRKLSQGNKFIHLLGKPNLWIRDIRHPWWSSKNLTDSRTNNIILIRSLAKKTQ